MNEDTFFEVFTLKLLSLDQQFKRYQRLKFRVAKGKIGVSRKNVLLLLHSSILYIIISLKLLV